MKDVIINWIVTNGIPILTIIVVALVADIFVNGLFGKVRQIRTYDLDEQDKRIKTVLSVIQSALKVLIFIIALLSILDQLHINIKPILAAAGVLGVAIGFGSQRFIEDIISGLIIILNREIRVGDVVKINGIQGYVEKITLNMVVLRDMEGSVSFIRNGKIDIVSNLTQDFSFYVTDISVSYSTDVEHAIQVIKSVGQDLLENGTSKDSILAPIEVFGLDKFDDSAIIIKTRIKTKPIKQWEVGREFNLLLKKAFDREGIEIPFPQCSVHIEK